MLLPPDREAEDKRSPKFADQSTNPNLSRWPQWSAVRLEVVVMSGEGRMLWHKRPTFRVGRYHVHPCYRSTAETERHNTEQIRHNNPKSRWFTTT